nr:type I DNA topoisomerase [Candidatus Synchoanobacter obligatus]
MTVSKQQTLVIVESPTKAKTVGRMVGSSYTVLASFGHVFELIPKNGAVEPDNHFHMNYQPVEKNLKHLTKIVSSAKKSTTLILATDPDREGEAIAWHICEYLKEKKAYDHLTVKRSTFHQITKKAIIHAIENPKDLNMHLVNAQHARRAMDYLLGFNISPLMWRTIKPGTSAGRVQSPALNLIVSRENARNQFETQEYWSITTESSIQKHPVTLTLYAQNQDKLDKFAITNDKEAQKIVSEIQKHKSAAVSDIKSQTRSRNPKAPFTTSTLQQEGSNKLGFPTAKTMKIAQELYEGIDIDGQQVGLITYMRTDSVHIATEAIPEIRDCIVNTYGSDHIPDSPRVFKTKTKNAQEAHEAIRPTHFDFPPNKIKEALSSDQLKLYQLIWSKTLASQMIPAQIDSTSVFVDIDQFQLKATGSVIKVAGFLKAYDDDQKQESKLPQIHAGDSVALLETNPHQHFTEPPPRYTEASLVKELEELGIGRPSTYASIISTLKKRQYVEIEGRKFIPTDIGDVVNKFLTLYFTMYIDHQFTAKMEDSLDDISRGEQGKEALLTTFWTGLSEQVQTISSDVKRSDVTHEELDEKCPECDATLLLKLGKHGKFIGCSQYPECNYTRPLNESAEKVEEKIDKPCPECSSDLIKKHSAAGSFIGCSNYPKCKHTEPLPENITDVDCPKCAKTKLIKRKSRRGKVFFGCPAYPKCKYATWNTPIKKACPACKWPIMTEKVLKKGTVIECPECKHKIDSDA